MFIYQNSTFNRQNFYFLHILLVLIIYGNNAIKVCKLIGHIYCVKIKVVKTDTALNDQRLIVSIQSQAMTIKFLWVYNRTIYT